MDRGELMLRNYYDKIIADKDETIKNLSETVKNLSEKK